MAVEDRPSTLFIGLQAPPELVIEIDQLARRRFLSRSDAIRTMLQLQLAVERERERRVDEAAA
jgi:metal-responsive CopG/Arc/MetJ family transcriptional regulator